MTFRYVSVEEAIAHEGLRMVVMGGVPSPWSEAAKGIFHLKGLDWVAVRLSHDDERLRQWAGSRSAPVVVHGQDRPRDGWAEILLLAERLAPEPALLPRDAAERALVFGLSHELCGEGGLGWSRRLQLVHAGLQGTGGFAAPIASYLGKKYGYSPQAGAASGARVADLLRMLALRLKAQRAAGSRYHVGDTLTAVDVYSATFAAMFKPLPLPTSSQPEVPGIRAAFETLDDATAAALDPILFEHRDMMYDRHLAPLSL